MKTSILAKAAVFSAVVLLSASCDKGGYGTGFDGVQPSAEVLGTYEFDGDSYDILTAICSDSGTQVTFIFSPLEYEPGKEVPTTYFAFSVDSYWADGMQHEVNDPAGENLDHQDDYFLLYEDPVHYYSEHREPAGGWFRVSENGSSWKLELDVQLADGTPLKVDYDGEYSAAPEQ